MQSPARKLLVLVLILAGAAWVVKVILSPAIADSLADRATSIADLEHALAWDPMNPAIHLRLGQAYQTVLEQVDLQTARRHLETALRQRPTHSRTWLQLTRLADRQGDRQRARQALAAALRDDPHNVSLRWEAALLALRWRDRDLALEHLRYVLSADPARRDIAFHLARALLGPGQSVATLLPDEPEPLTGLLQVAIRRQELPLARAAWERRSALTPTIPQGLGRQYLELLLRNGEAAAARRIWLTIAPDGHPSGPGNAIWNGGFEGSTLLGWGFDWQIQRVWGVEVGLDRLVAGEGRQSLRLLFNSHPTLDYSAVSQLVAVEPGREYRLRALARVVDFTTKPGLKLQVVVPRGDRVLAETREISGTTPDWVPLETHIRIPDYLEQVRVRVRREKGLPYDPDLDGTVWLDQVSLVPERS